MFIIVKTSYHKTSENDIFLIYWVATYSGEFEFLEKFGLTQASLILLQIFKITLASFFRPSMSLSRSSFKYSGFLRLRLSQFFFVVKMAKMSDFVSSNLQNSLIYKAFKW